MEQEEEEIKVVEEEEEEKGLELEESSIVAETAGRDDDNPFQI